MNYLNKQVKILSKLVLLIFLFGVSAVSTNAADSYVFGGPRVFYYDVEQSDVDQVATDLVNLGFSTASVEANTGGIGFDVGVGFPINDNIDIETSFVYMGQFKLTADMTGPTENLDATSSPWSIPVIAKIKIGDSDANFFAKAGWHFWRQNSQISSSKGSIDLYGTGNDAVLGFGGQVGNLQISYDHYNFSGVGAGMGIGEGGIGSLGISWSANF